MCAGPSRAVGRLVTLVALLGAGCTRTNVVPVTVGEILVIPDRLEALVADQSPLATELRDEEGKLLPDRPVRWESLNPDVVTVDAEGVVTAVGPGQALVTATADGAVGASQITVMERPSVRLSPDRVDLETVAGSRATVQSVVVVDNGGGGELGTLSIEVAYLQGEPGWLSADLSTATAPADLTVSATGRGLAVGSYQGSVLVSDGEASAELAVSLEVRERPPELSLGADHLDFTATHGEAPPNAQTVDVINGGGGSLTGLDVRIDPAAAGEWLAASVSPTTATPGDPATLTVKPTTTDLEPRTHTATVTVTTPVASSRAVSVSYEVREPPAEEPPRAPNRFDAERTGATQIHLTWADRSDNETRFEIQRRRSGQDSWTVIATVDADTEAYTDQGIELLTRHDYRVRACNAAGCSDWSKQDSA